MCSDLSNNHENYSSSADHRHQSLALETISQVFLWDGDYIADAHKHTDIITWIWPFSHNTLIIIETPFRYLFSLVGMPALHTFREPWRNLSLKILSISTKLWIHCLFYGQLPHSFLLKVGASPWQRELLDKNTVPWLNIRDDIFVPIWLLISWVKQSLNCLLHMFPITVQTTPGLIKPSSTSLPSVFLGGDENWPELLPTIRTRTPNSISLTNPCSSCSSLVNTAGFCSLSVLSGLLFSLSFWSRHTSLHL